MSDINKLGVIETIKDGFFIGVKNIGPILVNVILFIATCWIPYLNVGTVIGLSTGVITKASRGEPIPMTEIFDPKYRKFMGEFFLTAGLMSVGISVGMVLFVIPGFVIALAWSLALLLVVDKGKNPTEAISLSNNLTYGNKWRMFAVIFLPMLVFCIIIAILVNIPVVGWLFVVILYLFMIFVMIGIEASIYKKLASGV
ncbi:MAG: hypothetical protein LBI12_02770 [Treponema sp.]|jgi:hypothetical protein|nr:hypothetical protein [Treponema sp.]